MGRLTVLFGLLAFAAATTAPAEAGATSVPSRVASLGLCTDELVLLLAAPEQVVSVSYLGHDRHETPLAAKAGGLHSNDGKFSAVAGLKPDLVVTGGAVNRFAHELAAKTGTRVIDVPPPMTIEDLRRNIRTVARALGRTPQGEALIGWVDGQLGPTPVPRADGLMIMAGGFAASAVSISSELLTYAGIRQTGTPSGRVTLEGLIAAPPPLIVRSRYRSGQYSIPQAWLDSAVRVARTRTADVDGRLWLCPSPLAAADVARLREAFQ